MKRLMLAVASAFAASCAAGQAEGGKGFKVSSNDFRDGGPIPAKCAMEKAGGKNISPALAWEGVPDGTKSFAIICVDRHPIARGWIHWAVLDIPSDVRSLPAGASGKAMPGGALELENSFGFKGWGGPQPPPGSGRHKYEFVVYALGTPETSASGGFIDEAAFNTAVGRKTLAKASISGTFER